MKRKMMILGITLATLTYGVRHLRSAHRDTSHDKMELGIFRPDEINWMEAPASLPPGAKVALLQGDPAKEGPFTMRIWMPDGYTIPPHSHPKTEHVTVISGRFNLGMGEKLDKRAGRAMPAGTFGFWPAGMKHFAWTKRETVIQLHGTGPWSIVYVNASDDPRNAKK